MFIPCVTFADTAVSADRLEIIDHLKQEIAKQYVLEDKTPAILDSLKILSSSEELQLVSSDKEFAEAIDNKLKIFDKHFSFSWKANEKTDANQPSESYWERLERKNSGFSKVEISPKLEKSPSAILRKILRMILPERVFGNPETN